MNEENKEEFNNSPNKKITKHIVRVLIVLSIAFVLVFSWRTNYLLCSRKKYFLFLYDKQLLNF